MRNILTAQEIREIAKDCQDNDVSFKPDPWQTKVLEHHGSIALRTGRQVGKSEVVARKAARLATEFQNITILMIAAAQRQSSELFQKTLTQLIKIHKAMLEKVGNYKENPKLSKRKNDEFRRTFEAKYGLFEGNMTKTEVNLKTGVRLLSLPTGKTGAFIRCYTIDIMIPDEAAFIPEPVWTAVKPMLATSKEMRGFGWEIMLSTPFGKGGYYYECCHDPDFLQIHVSSEDCRRISRAFLQKEKKKMSKVEYAQEYLGEFIDNFRQFFSTALIKRCMTFMEWKYKELDKSKKYYLGIDIARYGADENAFVIVEMDPSGHLKVIKALTTERKSLTDTVGFAVNLHKKYNFNRIFTDDSGLGAGVTDMLIERIGKHTVEGINNSKKTVDQDKKKGILKEDLYSNALVLMEGSKLDIISNLKLQRSLKCMTFEYSSNANLKISGNYSHLAEAFVRACWCVKSKHLKLFAA